MDWLNGVLEENERLRAAAEKQEAAQRPLNGSASINLQNAEHLALAPAYQYLTFEFDMLRDKYPNVSLENPDDPTFLNKNMARLLKASLEDQENKLALAVQNGLRELIEKNQKLEQNLKQMELGLEEALSASRREHEGEIQKLRASYDAESAENAQRCKLTGAMFDRFYKEIETLLGSSDKLPQSLASHCLGSIRALQKELGNIWKLERDGFFSRTDAQEKSEEKYWEFARLLHNAWTTHLPSRERWSSLGVDSLFADLAEKTASFSEGIRYHWVMTAPESKIYF